MSESLRFIYHLFEEDYLIFQLFSGSKSELIEKKKRNEWMLLWFLPLVFGLYNLTNSNVWLGIYFFVIGLLTALFYKKYFNYRYKKRYQKIIRMSYKDSFGAEDVLELTQNHLIVKNTTGQGEVEFSEIEAVNEISTHLFIKLKSGSSLILPKKEVDTEKLKEVLTMQSINIKEELDWKW